MLNTVHALSSLISSPLLPEGTPLPGPQSGLLSNTRKLSVWGDMCWLSERIYWDGMPRQRAAGSGNSGDLLCHVFTVSGFRIMGFISRLPLACSYIWYDHGPSWWYTHLSAKVDSNMRASWRLARHIMGLHFLPPFGPSQIQSVSFQQQHHVPYVDLLLWDNLWGCKQSLLYLNKEGGFRQCFPNTFNNLCLMEVESKFQTG